jgi:hypothetical protein
MFGIDERQPQGESGAAALGARLRELALPFSAEPREWSGFFEGHEIRVVTRGILRARLHIDGECRDKRSPLLCTNRKVPLLSTRLHLIRPGVTIVEVYAGALLARRIEVRVAGEQVPMTLSVR